MSEAVNSGGLVASPVDRDTPPKLDGCQMYLHLDECVLFRLDGQLLCVRDHAHGLALPTQTDIAAALTALDGDTG